MLRRSCTLALLLSTFTFSACRGQDTNRVEAARLATLLNWQPGSVVADIGAGEGEMTLAAAERLGATGRVFTTELDLKKLAHLEELAAQEKLHNITSLQDAQSETNLPPECCNSIFIRRVYHHFTQPAQIDASLSRSLKPGGLLAVIDFPPRRWLPKVDGVPKNRRGHGIPQKILIDELTAAGFEVVTVPTDWPNDDYCVVFRKPAH
jgi:ubiquinone/menaquinone biosynthesis C-methylase UbiE